MTWLIASLVFFSCIEVALFVGLVLFYRKVKTSEILVTNLYKNQQNFLQMLQNNTAMEQEFLASFTQHKTELHNLDSEMQNRIQQLEGLLSRADAVIQSPEILRETILQGLRQGISKESLAHKTGASIQEIDIIATRYKANNLFS